MNYMEQVAKMLGVVMGERFNVKYHESYLSNSDGTSAEFFIGYSGFYCQSATNISESLANIFKYILNGTYTIKKIPFRPGEGEDYYTICGEIGTLDVIVHRNELEVYDLANFKLGNCFRTEEEARVHAKEIFEKLQKYYDEANK